ncbi:MAG: PilZ domain-containing protein [Pseudomonadota bacterium]
MTVEQRTEPRESLALPLRLEDGTWAVTRNISVSGMYLEIRGDHTLGASVVFEMAVMNSHMRFTAEGQIVRVEHRDGVTGLAVELRDSKLEPLP